MLDCCSWGGTRTLTLDGQTKAYGMTWMADWADVAVYAHEEGHSLGLPHSSGPYGQTYDSRWDVMSNPKNKTVPSDATGRPSTFGWTTTGKYILVVWEHVEDDPRTIKPVTAYEVPPPRRKKR